MNLKKNRGLMRSLKSSLPLLSCCWGRRVMLLRSIFNEWNKDNKENKENKENKK